MSAVPDLAGRLRTIPLPAVLLAAGATADPHDNARWHTDRGAISVTGPKFFNWNRDSGGGGAIDLVIHLYDLDFKSALAWLSSHFPGYTPAFASPVPSSCARKLELPAPDPDRLSCVRHYLRNERKIIPPVLDLLSKSGNLYADSSANAVFLMREEHGIPTGAELRGTGPRPWRGMAPGSRKDLGFFSVPNVHHNGVILCESAIDAVSCFLIHPHLWCISTAGARAKPAWLPNILSRGLLVYCGFDNDPTGESMAGAMIQRYPTIKRLPPPEHDWNDSLLSAS